MLIRYADDFLIVHPDKDELLVAVAQVTVVSRDGSALAPNENEDDAHIDSRWRKRGL